MAKTKSINPAQIAGIEAAVAKVLAGGVTYREGRTTMALESPCMDKRKTESRGIRNGALVVVGLGAYEAQGETEAGRETAYIEIHAGGYGDWATRLLLVREENFVATDEHADGWRLWGANFRDFTEEQASRWLRTLDVIAWESMDAFIVQAREAVQIGEAGFRPESNARTITNPIMFRTLEKLYAQAKANGTAAFTAEGLLLLIEDAAREESDEGAKRSSDRVVAILTEGTIGK
jgi:hypothetical protein